MTPHKHCELIKAWADGATIQSLCWKEEPNCRETVWIVWRFYWLTPSADLGK